MIDPSHAGDDEHFREPNDAVIEAAQELLRHADLVNVVPIEISASMREDARGRQPEDVRLTLESSYSTGKGAMANRFRYRIDLVDGEDAPVAELDFTLQVEYDVAAEYEPLDEAANFIAGTTGLFGAYPYARELAQNLTTRLQLDPLVLGLLPRGAGRPGRVTQVKRSEG